MVQKRSRDHQKIEKFFRPVLFRRSANDLARQDVKGSVQARSAMTLVIVGAALDLTGPERQHRLCAIVGRTGSRPPGRCLIV